MLQYYSSSIGQTIRFLLFLFLIAPFSFLSLPLSGQTSSGFIEGKLYVEITPRYQNMNWIFDQDFNKPKNHGLKKWILQYHITKIEKLEEGEVNNAYYFHFAKTHLTTAFVKALNDLPYIQKVGQIPIGGEKEDNYLDESTIASPPNSVLVPDAFSPNNDGSNDYFNLIGQNLSSYELQIFNRLGESVFQINEASPYGWDGRVNGKILPPGVYAYYGWARFEDGSTEILKGYLTLISTHWR